jgi:hypothetical protein
MRFNRRVGVFGHTFINISQRYFCPWRAAVIFKKKMNVISLLKRYLRLHYLYFVYIYWKYVLWLHIIKVLEQLNVYFVKESWLMSVLSKYVGSEKIVCFPFGKWERSYISGTFIISYFDCIVCIFLYIDACFIFHE